MSGTISYDNRIFRSIENTANGQVDGRTVFHYHHVGHVVWATYGGGDVSMGTLVATVGGDGRLDMRYTHVTADGRLMTGECKSTPEILPDGRLRLHEQWWWTCGDESTGSSVLEEVNND